MRNTKIIGEIGINHNGSVETTKELINMAKVAGCDYVKFQKRTPEICVPEEQKLLMRDTPWGKMTYIDYKMKVEFEKEEYDEIDRYCKEIGIEWFASVWDKPSVDFMRNYTNIAKIPSALITDKELVDYTRQKFDVLLISTGMSTEEEVVESIELCKPDVVFHTNSSYPSPIEELNLNYIPYLIEKYPNIEIGYSGHEFGLTTTFASVALGAKWVERHITLDRDMWGSDQKSSVEPVGLIKLCKGIRDIEKSLGSDEQNGRKLYPSELSKRKSLRGN
jgi:N-acetylneuraminate synthase|tara:strand:- start:11502 stop:12332 length:831 start_codon:yes stop_codon:yes gene_type:complete